MSPTRLIPRTAALFIALVALAPFGGSPAGADVVETVDGARLTGKITKINGGVVYLTTDYAGALEIDQAKVTAFTTDGPVFVRLASGTTMAGPVRSPGPGQLQVAGEDGLLTTQMDKVAASWQPAAEDPQVAALRAEKKKMERRWQYEAGVDITGKKGNTDKSGQAVRLQAKLVSPRDALKFFASIDRAKDEGVKSADQIKGGVDYSSYFYKNLGWYVRTGLETDEFEALDLRSTNAAGLSYRFFKIDDHSLEGRAGLSYRYESFDDGRTLDSPGLDFGLLQDWRFSPWGRIKNELTLTPSLEDTGNYLFTQDSGLEIPLGHSDFWKLRLGLANDYNSQPSPGRERLDTTYYSRLVLTWE